MLAEKRAIFAISFQCIHREEAALSKHMKKYGCSVAFTENKSISQWVRGVLRVDL